jgi:FOG: HEAT repeat
MGNKIEKIAALGEKGKQSKLLGYCTSKESEVRAAAAAALGKTKGDDGYNALINLLRDPDDSVRIASAAALGAMGSKNAMEHLRYMLNHEGSSDAMKAACKASMAILTSMKD